MVLKRLALNPTGLRVTVQSDNPAYPNGSLDDLKPIGRVIWGALRRLAAAASQISEPSDDREYGADTDADQRTLERILDRETVEESEENEDREETSSRSSTATFHGGLNGRGRLA